MRLVLVEQADFRRSEMTNFDALSAKFRRAMKPGDVVCFISGVGNQMVFVYLPLRLQDLGETREVVSSRRLRLRKGRWNPLMLVNYAEMAGIKIRGLKRYEEYFSEGKRDASSKNTQSAKPKSIQEKAA